MLRAALLHTVCHLKTPARFCNQGSFYGISGSAVAPAALAPTILARRLPGPVLPELGWRSSQKRGMFRFLRPTVKARETPDTGLRQEENTKEEQPLLKGPASSTSTSNGAGQEGAGHLLVAKGFYGLNSVAGVFLFPYITLYLSDMGASDSQIGVLCAFRPWLGMCAVMLGPLVADFFSCHKAMLVGSFALSTLFRVAMWSCHGFREVAILLLLADFTGGPLGPMVDSMVIAQCKSDADYGRQRLWGSVGWGSAAPIAGLLVQQKGIAAGFLGYALLSIPSGLLAMMFKHAPKGSAATKQQKGTEEKQPLLVAQAHADSTDAAHAEMSHAADTADNDQLVTPRRRTAAEQGDDQQAAAGAGVLSSDDKGGPGSAKSQASKRGRSVGPTGDLDTSPGARGDVSGVRDRDADSRSMGGNDQQRAAGDTSQVASSPDVMIPGKQQKSRILQAGVHRRSIPGAAAAGPLQTEALKTTGEPAAATDAEAAPADSFWSSLGLLMLRADVWQLLLQCLACGCGAGLIGTYLFLYVRDIGAGALLMGLMLTANCAAETPVFFFQGRLQQALGPNAMFHLALGATVLRLLCYGALPLIPGSSPWLVLPIELLQGLTLAAGWSAMCVLSKRLAPPQLAATMQGLATAFFGGLGSGIGGLLGGVLRELHWTWPATWTAAAGVVGALWAMSAMVPTVARLYPASLTARPSSYGKEDKQ